jgi:hypothetical protein
VCQEVGDMCGVATSLKGLGKSAIDTERGIQLLAVAQRLRWMERCPATEGQIADAAEWIGRLRASTPPDAFARAWTMGETLTAADAVALALEATAASESITERLDPTRAEG